MDAGESEEVSEQRHAAGKWRAALLAGCIWVPRGEPRGLSQAGGWETKGMRCGAGRGAQRKSKHAAGSLSPPSGGSSSSFQPQAQLSAPVASNAWGVGVMARPLTAPSVWAADRATMSFRVNPIATVAGEGGRSAAVR